MKQITTSNRCRKCLCRYEVSCRTTSRSAHAPHSVCLHEALVRSRPQMLPAVPAFAQCSACSETVRSPASSSPALVTIDSRTDRGPLQSRQVHPGAEGPLRRLMSPPPTHSHTHTPHLPVVVLAGACGPDIPGASERAGAAAGGGVRCRLPRVELGGGGGRHWCRGCVTSSIERGGVCCPQIRVN